MLCSLEKILTYKNPAVVKRFQKDFPEKAARADFCEAHFGEYLHHQPDLVPIFEKAGFKFETNLEKFLDYNYELFGADVIRRWFSTSLSGRAF